MNSWINVIFWRENQPQLSDPNGLDSDNVPSLRGITFQMLKSVTCKMRVRDIIVTGEIQEGQNLLDNFLFKSHAFPKTCHKRFLCFLCVIQEVLPYPNVDVYQRLVCYRKFKFRIWVAMQRGCTAQRFVLTPPLAPARDHPGHVT
jgi:hypothetical protein